MLKTNIRLSVGETVIYFNAFTKSLFALGALLTIKYSLLHVYTIICNTLPATISSLFT